MVLVAPFPFEVTTIDEIPEPRMEGINVVILGIHFDKGFPVEVVFGHHGFVIAVVFKREVFGHAQLGQVSGDVAAGIKQQAIPCGQRRLAEIKAGGVLKVRGGYQRALVVIRPAVDIADDVIPIATAFEHQGLAVAADVRQQFNALRGALEHFAVIQPAQGVVVPHVGGHQGVTVVLRRIGKQMGLL